MEALLEEEAANEEARKAQIALEAKEEQRRKLKNREALIDELQYSSAPAQNILQVFAETRAQQTTSTLPQPAPPRVSQFSTGIQFGRGQQGDFLQVPRVEEGPLYAYEPPTRVINGPIPPTYSQVDTDGYLAFVRRETDAECAGGYRSRTGCLRALEEAFVGLYYSPPLKIPNQNDMVC